MNVPSPCVSICAMDEATGFCKGCGRTLEEVAMWPYYSEEDKARVIAALDKRRKQEGVHD